MTAELHRTPTRVIGRYALYNEIAAGGMATVHIGRLLGPVGFARTVAIKRLHPQFAKDPEFVSMFLDEARLAARIQHPNVIATIDVVATDGELFLIMDYVRGETLSRLVKNARKAGRTVPARIAAAILCGFLHGLHAAHEAKGERGELLGLVHRDVSPQNILVGSDGVARVVDFGIAKAAGRLQITRDGQIKGKLAYMPPEQLHGGNITRAVDIYAAAVVMWEALTGERLFKGETEGETLTRILEGEVPPVSQIVSGIPAGYDEILARALQRDPGRRHATARELALQIERCGGLASPTEVGEWVEEIAGPTLLAREQEVASIESASVRTPTAASSSETSSSDTWGGAPPSTRGVPSSSRPWDAGTTETSGTRPTTTGSTTNLGLPVNRAVPVALGIAATLAILGIIVLVRALRADPPATPGTIAEPSATTSAAVTPAAQSAALSAPMGTPAPTGAPPEASAASGGPTPPPSPATQTATTPATAPKPTARPTARPTQPPTARPSKPGCDPPYTVDANGRRHYKLECM